MGAALTHEQGDAASKPTDASDIANLHQARTELRKMVLAADDNGKLRDELLRVCQREICRARTLIVDSDVDGPDSADVKPPFFSEGGPGRQSRQLKSGENLVRMAQAMVEMIGPYLEMEEEELDAPINDLLVLKQEKKQFVQEKNYTRAGEKHRLILEKEQKQFDDQTELLALRMKAGKLVRRLKCYVAELKPKIELCAKHKMFPQAGTFKIYKDRALTLHAALSRFVNRMTPNKVKTQFNEEFIKKTVSRRACLEPSVKEKMDRQSVKPKARGIPVTAGWRPLDDPDYIECRGGAEKFYFRMDQDPKFKEMELFGPIWELPQTKEKREKRPEKRGGGGGLAPAESAADSWFKGDALNA